MVGQKRFPVTDVFLEDLPNHLPELRSLATERQTIPMLSPFLSCFFFLLLVNTVTK